VTNVSDRILVNCSCTPELVGAKKLKQLGDSGDVFAMIQLGERCWSEADALVYDPDMDYSDKPQNIALRYFMPAVRGGAGNVTAVVAKIMFGDGNIIDAAAWDMIAHKFGQNRNDQCFAAEGTFGKLSYEQMTAAQQRGKEIAIQMGWPLFE
jgi:hypothetical protein